MLLAAARGCRSTCSSWRRRASRRRRWEDAGAVIGPAEVGELLDPAPRPGPGRGDGRAGACSGPTRRCCAKIARRRGRVGRLTAMPRASAGRDLHGLAPAGIRSDHESTTAEEARAKAALGMLVQVREGSAAQNLDALLPAARLRGDRRVLVPGHRRHLPRRPPRASGTSTACCAGSSPAACRPRSPSGTPRSSRPGTTAWATVGPWRPATGPTSWWSTTCATSASGSSSRTAGSSPGRAIPRRASSPANRAWEHGPRAAHRRVGVPAAAARRPARSSGSSPTRSSPGSRRARRHATGWRLGVRPGPGRRPDRQHRAAPGERPGRPGAGRRARPTTARGARRRRWRTTRTT